MKKTYFALLVALIVPPYAFAADGQVLINQATVMAAGGFPYKIAQPGSYKLSGNLTVPDANTTAILVNADHVTLDLNGFGIFGKTICVNGLGVTGFGSPVLSCTNTGTGNGIEVGNGGFFNNITVTNGTVRGMGKNGILLGGLGGNYVEKIHAVSNGLDGIVVIGVASNNMAIGNGQDGINVIGVVTGNTAIGNAGLGIFVNCPSTVANNTGNSNLVGNIGVAGTGCATANNTP